MSWTCKCGKIGLDDWACCPYCSTPKPVPEYNYRLLRYGEQILEGDEYYSSQYNAWKKANSFSGMTVSTDAIIRRKIEWKYRLLEDREILEREDEYYFRRTNEWVRIDPACAGTPYSRTETPVRRKINP